MPRRTGETDPDSGERSETGLQSADIAENHTVLPNSSPGGLNSSQIMGFRRRALLQSDEVWTAAARDPLIR